MFYSIQDKDGSYFEVFTALTWKRDSRRMTSVRTAETRAEILPEKEHDPQATEEISDTPDERELLYADVINTITCSIGAPAPNSPVCPYTKIIV